MIGPELFKVEIQNRNNNNNLPDLYNENSSTNFDNQITKQLKTLS